MFLKQKLINIAITWYRGITHDRRTPNCNYDKIYKEITRAITIHMPNKFNTYKHKKSTWITHGLLTSIGYRDQNVQTIKISKSKFK